MAIFGFFKKKKFFAKIKTFKKSLIGDGPNEF